MATAPEMGADVEVAISTSLQAAIVQPTKAMRNSAETRDRTGDLQIFSLTLSQLSYRGNCMWYAPNYPFV